MSGGPVIEAFQAADDLFRGKSAVELAAGMTRADRPGDLGDVIQPIRARGLPQAFADHLNPFVCLKFLELWDAAQLPANDY